MSAFERVIASYHIVSYHAPAVEGIERYRNPSVCLCNGAAALGAQLPQAAGTLGCLQLSHVRTADQSADGRRSAASRTAIGGGISSRRPRS